MSWWGAALGAIGGILSNREGRKSHEASIDAMNNAKTTRTPWGPTTDIGGYVPQEALRIYEDQAANFGQYMPGYQFRTGHGAGGYRGGGPSSGGFRDLSSQMAGGDIWSQGFGGGLRDYMSGAVGSGGAGAGLMGGIQGFNPMSIYGGQIDAANQAAFNPNAMNLQNFFLGQAGGVGQGGGGGGASFSGPRFSGGEDVNWLTQPVTDYSKSVLGGDFLNSNPYTDQILARIDREGQENVRKGARPIADFFASGGRYGSGAAGEAMGEHTARGAQAITDAQTDFLNSNWQFERGMQGQESALLNALNQGLIGKAGQDHATNVGGNSRVASAEIAAGASAHNAAQQRAMQERMGLYGLAGDMARLGSDNMFRGLGLGMQGLDSSTQREIQRLGLANENAGLQDQFNLGLLSAGNQNLSGQQAGMGAALDAYGRDMASMRNFGLGMGDLNMRSNLMDYNMNRDAFMYQQNFPWQNLFNMNNAVLPWATNFGTQTGGGQFIPGYQGGSDFGSGVLGGIGGWLALGGGRQKQPEVGGLAGAGLAEAYGGIG